MKISPVFSLPSEVRDAIEINYVNASDVIQWISAFEKSEGDLLKDISDRDLASLGESGSLIKIVDAMLYFAIKQGASDIHIEPFEEKARLRLRIDGRLQEMFSFSRAILPAVVSRLKIMARVDIVESRFPQDGRISIKIGLSEGDFRASFCPTIYGSNVVLRILPSTGRTEIMGLDEMMLVQDVQQPLKRLVKSPNGIFFVTGPTGSGKTTTLYTILQEINLPDLKIATIEDPVEVRMDGVAQSQVNHFIDLSFALVLRSLLRQDPDVILVGEIRDFETAKIATEAALTGHLVLSTLHTNTAVQAIVRLIELGIEPYMVAPSIIGVLAQRLGRRICNLCKQSYFPSHEELSRYFYDVEDEQLPFYRGSGCDACDDTGYKGRVAFHELVVVGEDLRNLIFTQAGIQELTQAAAKMGYRSLRFDGLLKVLLGLTTVEEVEKHAPLEWV